MEVDFDKLNEQSNFYFYSLNNQYSFKLKKL